MADYDYPIDVELDGIDDILSGDVGNIFDQAENLGYDTDDPEVMAGLISRIAKGIKKAVRRRKRRKRAGKAMKLPDEFSLDKSGLSYSNVSRPGPGAMPMQQKTLMDKVTENPLMLIGPALALILFMKKSKK